MGLPEVVRRLGQDPTPIFSSEGFDLTQFVNPDAVLPYVPASRLLARCVTATRCDHIGLLLGEAATPSSLGVAGFMLKSAPDVGSALRDLVAHIDLHDQGGSVILTSNDGFAELGYLIHEPEAEAVDQIYDLSGVMIYKILRDLCGERWNPSEILLSRQPPKDPAPYRRIFRTTPSFGADRAAVAFPSRWLKQPIRTADPVLHRYLQMEAEALQSMRAGHLAGSVRRLLRESLPTTRCSAPDIARRLHMHERTLNRRLRNHGTTFRQELESVRYEVARQLLANGKMPILEVAATLGYADATAFSRAFKRWSGTTPAQWRSCHSPESPGRW